jgi:hypothetical protein
MYLDVAVGLGIGGLANHRHNHTRLREDAQHAHHLSNLLLFAVDTRGRLRDDWTRFKPACTS